LIAGLGPGLLREGTERLSGDPWGAVGGELVVECARPLPLSGAAVRRHGYQDRRRDNVTGSTRFRVRGLLCIPLRFGIWPA
jgi:hypothetical protein